MPDVDDDTKEKLKDDEQAEEYFDERIELKPKERIQQVIETARLKPTLDEFIGQDLTGENIKIFKASVDQSYLHTMMSLNERLNEIFKVLEPYPAFKRFFRSVIQKKTKRKTGRRTIDLIWEFTESEHIDNVDKIIELLSYFIPRCMFIIEVLKTAVDKQDSYMFSEQPAQVKHVKGVGKVQTFGKGRSQRAWDLRHLDKKTDDDIAKDLGIAKKQVAAYVKYWDKKLKKENRHPDQIDKLDEAVKAVDDENDKEDDDTEDKAEEPIEAKT